MQITGAVVLVVLSIILFEVFPEKSAWSIPVRQADEHMVAVSASGGSLYYSCDEKHIKLALKNSNNFGREY
jgi:hypothetical protein